MVDADKIKKLEELKYGTKIILKNGSKIEVYTQKKEIEKQILKNKPIPSFYKEKT
jgi:hypothetical protein